MKPKNLGVALIARDSTVAERLEPARHRLEEWNIPYRDHLVATDEEASTLGTSAGKQGYQALIVGDAEDGALARTVAAPATLPCIVVPFLQEGTPVMAAIQSLVQTVTAPQGAAYGCMAIDKPENAAIFVARILADNGDSRLHALLVEHSYRMTNEALSGFPKKSL